MRKTLAATLLLGWMLGLGPASAAQGTRPVRIKMGTLVPAGTVWHKILVKMKADWRDATRGRVDLVVYPGGVAGDEPDVVRKMRIGQLQAATFTTTGLIDIDTHFSVLAIPMFFESYDEVYHVLKGLEPSLKARLEQKGFVLLNWEFGGWVYFFSKGPIETVQDLKSNKIFVWAGDDRMVSFWKKNGFRPVPLAATDIMMGLQTGMIGALHTTPLASLSLQWFRITPYMLDVGLLPLLGANVVAKTAWEQIAPSDRAAILDLCAAAGERTFREIPRQDEDAIRQMEERTLRVVRPDPDGMQGFVELAAAFAEIMRREQVPAEIYGQALRLRDEFRERKVTTLSQR